ncbi:hypothetical protein BC940DRAFT_313949 [Gongronella butleri]|nr:hypothetical protein BC940DRAFT_313949 [Gongronella butleri]
MLVFVGPFCPWGLCMCVVRCSDVLSVMFIRGVKRKLPLVCYGWGGGANKRSWEQPMPGPNPPFLLHPSIEDTRCIHPSIHP